MPSQFFAILEQVSAWATVEQARNKNKIYFMFLTLAGTKSSSTKKYVFPCHLAFPETSLLNRQGGIMFRSLVFTAIFFMSFSLAAQQPRVEFLATFAGAQQKGSTVPYAVRVLRNQSILTVGFVDFGNLHQDWFTYQLNPSQRPIQYQIPPRVAGGVAQARDLVEVQEGQSSAIYVTGADTYQRVGARSFVRSIVRKSIDGGKTWRNVDEFYSPNLYFSGTTDITADNRGNIYYVGHHCDDAICMWFVRKSTNRGRSWFTLDLVPTQPLAFWEPQQIEVMASGRIAIIGFVGQKSSEVGGIVRISNPQQNKWENVGYYKMPGAKRTNFWSMATDARGGVYALAISDHPNGQASYGHIRYSPNGVSGWVTVDEFLMNGVTTPRAVRLSPEGHVYVSWRSQFSDGGHNIFRVKCDGQSQWKTWVDIPPTLPVWAAIDFQIPKDGTVIFSGPFLASARSPQIGTIGRVSALPPCSR